MGGAVASYYSYRNRRSEVPHSLLVSHRARTDLSVETHAGEDPTFDAATQCRVRRSPSTVGLSSKEIQEQYYGILIVELRNYCMSHREERAIAYRPIEQVKQKLTTGPTGKERTFNVIVLGPTKYMSCGEMWHQMECFGCGLTTLGLTRGSKVGIYEETRKEWLISCYALWNQGMVGVTVYANLGEDALLYAIQEAELNALICNGKSYATLKRLCDSAAIAVPQLIVLDTMPSDAPDNVVPWDTVLKRGEEMELTKSAPPEVDPEDLALIMYTSGTTGDPKGVMITHGNATAAVRGLQRRVSSMEQCDDETYLAYLPLAHILEFAAENVMLFRGALLCYGNVRTLSDTFAEPHGDLREFKPVFLVGVPRIFETLRKGVLDKLPPPGSIKRTVFDQAYKERRLALEQGRDTPFYNSKVFAVVRDRLGGRVKYIVSGGAPLSGATYEFLAVVFGCAVAQGYGLTETCAAGTVQRYFGMEPENIGGILPGLEMKLRDVEGWSHTDALPCGEILFRGPMITKGYYKQPEKTAEAFLPGGWFATSDVGQLQPNGTLKIIGRTKSLVKNQHGEYIALEALESIYVHNPLAIPNGVCIVAVAQSPYIVALVLTDEGKATAFAAKHNIDVEFPALLEDPTFRQKALESFAQTARDMHRKPFEVVRQVRVLADEWTPENGVLTAAMKLKRRVIDERYRELIQQLLQECCEGAT